MNIRPTHRVAKLRVCVISNPYNRNKKPLVVSKTLPRCIVSLCGHASPATMNKKPSVVVAFKRSEKSDGPRGTSDGEHDQRSPRATDLGIDLSGDPSGDLSLSGIVSGKLTSCSCYPDSLGRP